MTTIPWTRSARRSRQSGMSLPEVLISVTILALAIVISLTLYDGARRSFKIGDNLAEQQQVVRIAFDKLSSDLRKAGYNHNPDGSVSRPDEQIEGTWPGAIAFRADFDRETENALEGGAFDSVSIGNDEIVAYALVSARGSNPDSLVFEADASRPRDGTATERRIDGVDLTHDEPPYTLYRYSFNDAGAPVPTPLIDNVRSLNFTYLDAAGTVLTPVAGAEDEPAREARAAVRRIGVEIEGMTRDSDPRWIDLADADVASRGFRKFRLSGDVTPRNLGSFGLRDLQADLTPPPAPARPDLYTGHCGGLYVNWLDNPSYDPVSYYRVLYGDSPGTLDSNRPSTATEYYLGGLNDGERYYVAIQAVDTSGNLSPPSPTESATTLNKLPENVPARTLSLATTAQTAAIELSWDAVVDNVGSTTGDPRSPQIRDLRGYEIHRREAFGTFTSGGLLAEVAASSPRVFRDVKAVACQEYDYRVRAIDQCDEPGAYSDIESAAADPAGIPRHPLNAEAFLVGNDVRLKWSPVREVDAAPATPIYIDDYKVWWTGKIPTASSPDIPGDFVWLADVSGATEYFHDIDLVSGETVYYLLTAVDRCSPPNESTYSYSSSATLPQPTCTFEGDVVFLQPSYGTSVSGTVRLEADVQGRSGSYAGQKFRFFNEENGSIWEQPLSGNGPWIYDWNTTPAADGAWRIRVEVDYLDGPQGPCTQSKTIRVLKSGV